MRVETSDNVHGTCEPQRWDLELEEFPHEDKIKVTRQQTDQPVHTSLNIFTYAK